MNAARMANFGRALRARAVRVALADERDGLAAMELVDAFDPGELRRALGAALKIQPRDRAAFEELFESFYGKALEVPSASHEPNPPFVDPTKPPRTPRRATPPDAAPEFEDGGTGEAPGEEPGYSAEELLRRKPFDALSDAELQAMERLLSRLVRRVATRPSRRLAPSRRGAIDLRRSFRRTLRHGGELFDLARRAPAIEEPRLVVLCDTSGSMDPHSRFLLSFVLGLRAASRSARSSEIFAFNTALVRLTPWIRPVVGVGSRASAAFSSAWPPAYPTGRAAPGSASAWKRSRIVTCRLWSTVIRW